MIQAAVFYLFAGILLFSAVMVITARNPVHSVLFLILAFFNSAGLFLMLGAEFLALILVIVYVGAVAVLFLFVVMMLDISFTELRKGAMRSVPIGLLVGGVLLAELFTLFMAWKPSAEALANRAVPLDDLAPAVTNTEALGQVLYTQYFMIFQTAGLILLVAMIGAIVLTLRQRSGVRRQSVAAQNSRTPKDAMEIRKISPGMGA